jgi:hypothetical protein
MVAAPRTAIFDPVELIHQSTLPAIGLAAD